MERGARMKQLRRGCAKEWKKGLIRDWRDFKRRCRRVQIRLKVSVSSWGEVRKKSKVG